MVVMAVITRYRKDSQIFLQMGEGMLGYTLALYWLSQKVVENKPKFIKILMTFISLEY